MKIERLKLQRVRYMPKELQPGVLYVAQEFGAAAHLCACGCGSKVRTPLGPTDWALEDRLGGPTLLPSIGNWQLECRSHYWIWEGRIYWSDQWTPEQIAAGRRGEEERAREYYETRVRHQGGLLGRFWHWVKRRVGQKSALTAFALRSAANLRHFWFRKSIRNYRRGRTGSLGLVQTGLAADIAMPTGAG